MSKNYKFLALKEIAGIKYGRHLRKAVVEVKDSGVVIVQMKNASIDGINWKDCISTEAESIGDTYWLEVNDILFMSRGNKHYAVRVDESINEIDAKAVAAPSWFSIRADTKVIMPEYLTWWLNQPPAQAYLEQEVQGDKSKHILRSTLENLVVAIPSFEEQEAVINMIEATRIEKERLESCIERNAELLSNLAVMMADEK